MQFGIGLEAGAEGLQILKAQLPGDGQHLGFVALDLVESDLVNPVWCQIGGSGAADEELIVLCAVGQGIDAQRVAAGGQVGDFEEAGETQICGQDLFADGVEHLDPDAFLRGGLDGCGKALQRQSQRRVFRLLIGQLLDLIEGFGDQELGGTRWSSMPMDMLVVTWSKALGI